MSYLKKFKKFNVRTKNVFTLFNKKVFNPYKKIVVSHKSIKYDMENKIFIKSSITYNQKFDPKIKITIIS